MINLTMLLPMTTQRASKNHRFIYNCSSDSNCCSVTMTAAVRTKTKRKILLSAILIALSTLSFFLVLLDDDGNYNLGFFSSYYYSQHLNYFNKYHKRHHRQRDRQLQAKYIDYRQECIKAITKTPGHDLFNSNDGVPIQKKVHRPLGKMYVYSPRKEYEVMRDEKYGGCDRCLPFPMPYQTMLHPETMRKLGLPSIDEQEVLHRGSSPGSKIVANAAEKSSTDSNTHQTHRSMFPRPYTTTQAINTLSRFQSEAFLLRYSSNRDEFHFYVRRSQLWNVHLAHHARAVEETLIPILRRDHGHRFRKTSQGGRDFAVVISTGDNPKVSCNCMSVPSNREELPKWLEKDFAFVPSSGGGNGKGRCNRYEFSPIWQFGSGFVNPDVMPSMVTFPPWSEHHLGCFRSYRFEDRVCDAFLERSDRNPGGIYFGMHELEIGLGGEDDDGNEVEDSEGAEEIGKNYNGDVAADMAPPEQEVATSQERMRRALQQVPKGGGDTSNPKDLDRNKVPVVYYDRQRRQLVERASELTSTVAFPNNGKSNIITIPIFNYLKPQIIWRGTDFSFLNCLASGHHYFHLTPDQAVYGPTDPAVFDAAGAAIPDEETIGTAPSTPIAHQRKSFIDGLFQSWGSLTPRWKAVTLSLEAEMIAEKVNQELNTLNEQISLQHQRKDDANSASSTDMRAAFSFPKPRTQIHEALPWIDAKFTDKQRTPSETNRWIEFHEQDGHFVGGHMSWKEASSYKYHIDIGGGGGTTWQGTLSKLALPGVLFHHETPTFDWFHEDLLPWVHYIPISTELPDLEEKFEWAENHPLEARAISEAATAFVRYAGTMEYWERVYDRMFVKRVAPTLEAFVPMDVPVFESEGEEETYDDELAFLELAKDLGFPLKRLFP